MPNTGKRFCLKVRASSKGVHTSGAEHIVGTSAVRPFAAAMLDRVLGHAKGTPDFINLKLNEIDPAKIQYLDALPATTRQASSPSVGLEIMREQLADLGIENPEKVVTMLVEAPPMRGAILLNADTMERLEPDQERGIRVTCMDDARIAEKPLCSTKNHFEEALVLATKVANAPHIIAELCISDDPDYVTGYIASKAKGYIRITSVKEPGSPRGGRIFLFRGTRQAANETIAFLEKQPVLIRNIRPPQPASHKDPWRRLEEKLDLLKKENLYRTPSVLESISSRYVRRQGKTYLMFASNDYLDLIAEPFMKQASREATDQWGTGTGGSRLTTGTLPLHEELERELASFKATESAILFNTGYMANVGTISALAGQGDLIFSDELNHASMIDGCRLSRAETIVYRHNDFADLETKILENSCRHGLIVSDAVFSMDGDIVRLPELTAIARRYGFLSMIDEAHSTGVLGATGHGITEHYGAACQPDIIMGTLSKSMGSLGGFVCGKRLLTDYLRNTSRSYIFSTSLPPGTIAGALAALRYLATHSDRTVQLRHNMAFFAAALQERGIQAHSETAILPIIIGDESRALAASEALLARGIIIPAIRYPTVPRGTARLRVTLMSTHTREDLTQAADALSEILIHL